METRTNLIGLALLLVVLGALMRLLPHEANFTPIAAISLFGAVYLSPRLALAVPLLALLLSDMVLGFDSLGGRLVVYGSFLLVGLIGLLIRRRATILTVIAASLGSSIIFYLVTNFAYFYPPTMYSHDLNGIISSYVNALPFFRGTILGDLFYSGILFGSYELARRFLQNKATGKLSIIRLN